GRAELRRKFWFDRTVGNRLTRQQTFENGTGRLGSDIYYSDWTRVPESSRDWPMRIVIDRHNDGYRLELLLEKNSVAINPELPDTAFILENDEKLKEVDLDAPRKQINVDVTRKAAAEPNKPQSSAFRRQER
ncbi:MAG TPA: hypothetical protein VNO70_24805, partial [Blastocatellia bacterium]|nr:hypothetical protein [Blastocatellia bacterium]